MTPKQAEILNYIIERQSNDGVSPSYREIARAVGVAGCGNIARHIQMLERDGWIGWVNRAAPELAQASGGELTAIVATLDKLVREHLASLAAMPIERLSQ